MWRSTTLSLYSLSSCLGFFWDSALHTRRPCIQCNAILQSEAVCCFGEGWFAKVCITIYCVDTKATLCRVPGCIQPLTPSPKPIFPTRAGSFTPGCSQTEWSSASAKISFLFLPELRWLTLTRDTCDTFDTCGHKLVYFIRVLVLCHWKRTSSRILRIPHPLPTTPTRVGGGATQVASPTQDGDWGSVAKE